MDDRYVEVVDQVSFSINEAEVFGLAGESGCGKSVTALSVLRLLPMPASRILSGEILFRGRDILKMSIEDMRALRGAEISMIFQEPFSALNPLQTIKRQLEECYDYHPLQEKKGNLRGRINTILRRVGFSDPGRILAAYPHELSGGMLQRIVIAMALLLKPGLVIADEPTTALDVTVQAQIMELLRELQKESGTAILLITHNLNLIAQYANRLAVMYAGRIVEENQVQDFIRHPQHPYTLGLLKALPNLASKTELVPIPGQVPQPSEFESGCRFRQRCGEAFDSCTAKPELKECKPHHRVACFLPEVGAGNRNE
ncbi:MAG: ABC transporter ATP-binding protein [Fibrobacteria bacterium]|nr:ABC transporter ATP-binding protein [Fibrobacteria bacterium]